MENIITKIIKYVQTDIWNIQLNKVPTAEVLLIKTLRIIFLTIKKFEEYNCLLKASAFTFYTLLSVVPLAALSFGIAKGFAFEKILEKRLLEHFEGQETIILQIINYGHSLLENTKGGTLAGFGIVILLWSIIKLFVNIEDFFNEIWKIKTPRTLGRKFSNYFSIMLISPILIIVTGSVTVFITAQVTEVVNNIVLLGFLSPMIAFLLHLLPYCLIWLLFIYLYVAMPNTRVNLLSGILSGFIAGTVYLIVQRTYIFFQIGVAKYNAIYGSFAALPLFLIWLNISWIIILTGAVFCFAHQNVDKYEFEPNCQKVSPSFKKKLSLQFAYLIIKAFANAEKPLTIDDISKKMEIPYFLGSEILEELVESGILVEAKPRSDEFVYQPALDINILTIEYILEALDNKGITSIPCTHTEELKVFSETLHIFQEKIKQIPENKLLKDI
jgi:membrane protein